MTPEQLAALQAGTPMEEVLAMATDPAEQSEQSEAGATDATKSAATTAPANTDAPAMTIEAAMAKITELEASATEVAGQLAETTTKLQTAEAKVGMLEAGATASTATITAMTNQLRPYVAQMNVALSAGVDAANLNGEALATAHSDLRSRFQATYKTGKQSKSAPATVTQKTDAESKMLASAAAFQL